ncbi:DnaB-like helicase C-terminal domain-containing protein [Streptomyces mayteni]
MSITWTTPWPQVTPLLGLRSGAVSVVASVSTVGKSTFALNIATHNALAGRGVVFGSSEWDLRTLQEKALAAHLGLDILQGLPAERRSDADALGEHMDRGPFNFASAGRDDNSALVDVERGLMKLTDRGEPSALIVIDSIQGFSEPSAPNAIARHMRSLRRFAVEHNAAVLVVAFPEPHATGHPGLNDIHADAVANADTVVSLHRQIPYWDRNTPEKPETTVQALKGAPSGRTAYLLLEAPYCRFITSEDSDR